MVLLGRMINNKCRFWLVPCTAPACSYPGSVHLPRIPELPRMLLHLDDVGLLLDFSFFKLVNLVRLVGVGASPSFSKINFGDVPRYFTSTFLNSSSSSSFLPLFLFQAGPTCLVSGLHSFSNAVKLLMLCFTMAKAASSMVCWSTD